MMMVRKSKGLGERHEKILNFIQEYQHTHKHPPSIREIGEYCDISSTSVVNYYLDQLEDKGMIKRDRKISRGLQVVGTQSTMDTLKVPVLGPIAAGPLLPVPEPGVNYHNENEYEAVEIARSLLSAREKGNDLFALRVQGDSMIDAMINDGDIVVMKPAKDARNGEMVAIRVDDEYTLKYFFKEKDGYRLQPANPTMKPIMLTKSAPIEIGGKVVMVIRKMEIH
jgi:repressor LexA